MPNRIALAPAFLALLVLGACATPSSTPSIVTQSPPPVTTATLAEETVRPDPTATPAEPTSTPPADTVPGGGAGQEAILAVAVETTAKALGVDQSAVSVISIDAVQWPDSCLGVSITDQACAEVITPGYRVVVDVDGERYAVHTNEDGSAVRFAGPAEPPAAAIPDQLGMVWRSPGEPCRSAAITLDSIAFGACDGPLVEAPLGSQDLADDLGVYTSLYASFEALTPAGSLVFYGAGPAMATPDEQRMMAEWAQLAAQQAEMGHSDALWGLALAWHREGGFAGFCDDLAVYAGGYGVPSTCQADPPKTLSKRWLAASQTRQLFAWIDSLASYQFGQKDPATADAMTVELVFTGAGTGEATDQDQQAMLDFAAWLTTFGAQATDVRYVTALTDLPVTSGPGSQFTLIDELLAGQTAFVTGTSPDRQWWRVICADGTVDNCWVTADPGRSQPAETPAQVAVDTPTAAWDPVEIYAAVIHQVVTVDHTFGQPPSFPVVYLVRQTSGNAATPGSSVGSETIFPGDQQRISALLGDLPHQFVWVDRMEDVPRAAYDLVSDNGAIVQVGAIVPQVDGSLHVPGSIFVGPLAAGGQTYILQFDNGVWSITGKAGPVWIS